jgi:hypothetical protein
VLHVNVQMQPVICCTVPVCCDRLLLLLLLLLLLQSLTGREVCCYSISCKVQNNIDITLEWLTKHAKS